MIKMKQLFLLCSTLFMLNTLFAQSNVKGSILTSDGVPAEFATVVILSANDSSMVKAGYSDERGMFDVPGLSSGDYLLEVTSVGFSNFISSVFTLPEGKTKIFDKVMLKTMGTDLSEVVVTAQRSIIEVHPDKTVFNVEGSINATGNSALELLRKSPGVIVDNNDNIMLQGKSGVKVYINGKPSPLSTDDLANFLRTMQSNEIHSIEIITNPSAKYEAEGNAGIINIKLRKDKSLGTNATLNTGYAIGKHSKFNNSVNLNHRDTKVNLFGSYSNFTGKNERFMNGMRDQFDQQLNLATVMVNDDVSHNFKLGTDYFINEKNTIGLLFSGYVTDNEWSNKTRTSIFQRPQIELLSILDAENAILSDRNNMNFNLNYQFDGGDGRTWNFDADYGRFENKSDSDQPNRYYDPTGTILDSIRVFASLAKTNIDIYTFKGDHERKLWEGALSMGFKYSNVKTDNGFDFFDVPDGTRVLNDERSNRFVYSEIVTAGYLMYNKKIKDFNVNLGVRVEHTKSEGDLTSSVATTDTNVDRDYIDVFPSAGLSYNLNQKNTLRVNYSRRIDRPGYQDLNPFEFKLDELSFMKGNPFLNPQYTNNYQIAWQHNYTLNVSLGYSVTDDYFTRITDTLNGNATILTWENLATQKNWSLNISYPWSPTKWYSIYANFTAFRTENFADFGDGKVIDVTVNAYNVYSSHTFSLPKDFKLEISGFYSSPSIWGGNFETGNFWGIDAGIQKKLFDGRGNLKLAVSDIFEGMRWSGSNKFGDLAIDVNGGWESRQFKVNFSYLFGNNEVKSARRRKVGLEEESSRIKTEQN